MAHKTEHHTVHEHFEKCSAEVKETYQRLLAAAMEFGPVTEDPKKTSIHLVRKTAFAGVATRKTALLLTLKSAANIDSERVLKREQPSPHRWHIEVRLDAVRQVDAELRDWPRKAYELSG